MEEMTPPPAAPRRRRRPHHPNPTQSNPIHPNPMEEMTPPPAAARRRRRPHHPNPTQSNPIHPNPMEETTTAAAACEIARLPEDLLSAAISRTAPRDACRAAAVSPAFRAAADSDAVWACFLPRDLPPLADGELGLDGPARPPLPKKALFMRLSAGPRRLAHRLMSMWLDRESGAKCFMLPAMALYIVWSDAPRIRIPLTDSSIPEGTELVDGRWSEISGKIQSKMLTQNSTYAAYMVFKLGDLTLALYSHDQKASVSIGERGTTLLVCFGRNRRVPRSGSNVRPPQKRADGWLELELGEFYNEKGDDGEVSISLMETIGGHWKKGLIVQGIEIRPKK